MLNAQFFLALGIIGSIILWVVHKLFEPHLKIKKISQFDLNYIEYKKYLSDQETLVK